MESSSSDKNNANDSTKSNNSNIITINRSTFTKLLVIGIASLMIASFFGGYNLGGGGKTVTILQTGSGNANSPSNLLQQPQQQALQPGIQPQQQPGQQQPPSAKIRSISINGAPVQGNANAPVTLVEFSDFQCPFCERFFSSTLPQIEQEYVDTGKVKLVYKQFPLDSLHPNAKVSALASECANEQGKFWPYHNTLFGNQTQWAEQSPTQVISTFKKYATDLGMNVASFNTCMDSKKYSSIIDKELEEGSTYGVSGTPTFYVGNEKSGYTQLIGAQPFSAFQQIIDGQQ